MSLNKIIAAGLFVVASATAGHAASVSFGPTGWVNEQNAAQATEWTVVIDDTTAAAGFDYRFSINYTGGTNIGSVLGFGAGTSLDMTGASFALVSSNVVTALGTPCIGTDLSSCGSGLNWNGGGPSNPGGFEFILPTNTPGTSTGLLTSLVFDLGVTNNVALSATLFDSVGLRLQEYGTAPNGAGGSLKAWNLAGTFSGCPDGTVPDPITGCDSNTSVIPLPAGLPLLLSALGIGAIVRRFGRKNA